VQLKVGDLVRFSDRLRRGLHGATSGILVVLGTYGVPTAFRTPQWRVMDPTTGKVYAQEETDFEVISESR